MPVTVPCSVCASPIPNNLVRLGEVIAFVHNDQVVMHHVNKSVTEVTKRHAGSMITNLRCDHFGGQKVIVATSTKGVFVWDATLTNLLCEIAVTPAGSPAVEGEVFCQGVCMCRIGESLHCCIGTSTGSLHLFRFSNPESLTQATQAAVLGGDGVPVLALEWLSGTVERLCASSGDGLVSLYAVGTDSMVFRNSVSMSAPVIMLAHTHTKLLCGSAQGDISILQQDTLVVVMEIAAHSRLLSTMELHPTDPFLLTAAQDGTATVWDLAELDQNKLSVRRSCLWNNTMITGGTFGANCEFYLSSYSAPVVGMFEYQTGATC